MPKYTYEEKSESLTCENNSEMKINDMLLQVWFFYIATSILMKGSKMFLLLSEIDKQQIYHEKKVDCQQFHRYHKTNELSPLTSNNYTKRPQHMALEIQVLAWDRLKNVVGLNRLMYL